LNTAERMAVSYITASSQLFGDSRPWTHGAGRWLETFPLGEPVAGEGSPIAIVHGNEKEIELRSLRATTQRFHMATGVAEGRVLRLRVWQDGSPVVTP
jgi:hypothetical protein